MHRVGTVKGWQNISHVSAILPMQDIPSSTPSPQRAPAAAVGGGGEPATGAGQGSTVGPVPGGPDMAPGTGQPQPNHNVGAT